MSGRDVLRDLLTAMPADTRFTPAGVLELLDRHNTHGAATVSLVGPEAVQGGTWVTWFWSCSPNTRVGVSELAEALGRKRTFVYAAVYDDDDPLPGKKLVGQWSFKVGDVRAWVERNLVAP